MFENPIAPKPAAKEKREMGIELKCARFIWQYINQAIEIQSADIRAGKSPDKLHLYLAKIWPGKVDGPGRAFHLPDNEFPPDLVKETLIFKDQYRDYDDEGSGQEGDAGETRYDMNGEYCGIRFYTGSINDSRGEAREAIKKQMQSVIFHETQHIYARGADRDALIQHFQSLLKNPKDTEETQTAEKLKKQINLDVKFLERLGSVLYFSDPNEINAYAFQFASYYADEFPDESFNLDKFKAVMEKLPNLQFITDNYMKIFSDSAIQGKYDFYVKNFYGFGLSEVQQKFFTKLTAAVEQLQA